MFTFYKNLLINNKLVPKTIRRIGEDLRKGGAIVGIGIVGFILPNDNIGFVETLILMMFGILSWLIGLCFEFFADMIEMKSQESENNQH